ncbi:MAG TPA: AI-2E family transporter [Candidatus Acidoferrales bacterium]|nr:AI-2E family transporter [Candidatus Acidoferrales bacterium]
MTADSNTQKRVGTVLFYGILLLLAYLVYEIFEPFLAALAWAVILVVFCYPAYNKLQRHQGRTLAAATSTAGVILILIIPTLLVMAAFVREGVDAAHSIQSGMANGHYAWVNNLWARIQQRLPGTTPTDLATILHRYAEKAAGYLAEQLGSILKNMALFLFHLGVAVLAMFYLFRDGEAIMLRLRAVLPFEEGPREHMLREGRDLIIASVMSSLAAACAHGMLGGLAFAVTGITSPIFWGVMMGFFSLVPVVGSAVIWLPAAISLMIGGHLVRGIILIIICGAIVSVVDNVVRPWLISGRAEMGGLVIFISVLGGISVFGLLGVVMGPIIVATAMSMLDLAIPSIRKRNKFAKADGK